jgi:hypothetical protein
MSDGRVTGYEGHEVAEKCDFRGVLAWVDMTLEARRVTCFAYIQDRALFSNVDSTFFFAFMELRLKRQLTDDAPRPFVNASDFGIVNDVSDRLRRERVLASMPQQLRARVRMIVGLKFLCLWILVFEVLLLQR